MTDLAMLHDRCVAVPLPYRMACLGRILCPVHDQPGQVEGDAHPQCCGRDVPPVGEMDRDKYSGTDRQWSVR